MSVPGQAKRATLVGAVGMRHDLRCLTVIASVMFSACGAGQRDQRPGLTMTHEPKVADSPCGRETGVELRATVTACVPGKPPSYNAALDVSISSALDRPIWFVFDLTDQRRRINEVSLSRTGSSPALPLWQWASDRALRLPPRAEIQLRSVSVQASGPHPRVTLWVANEVRVDGQPVAEWLGRPGLTPASGDFLVDQDNSSRPDAVRRASEPEGVPIASDLLCRCEISLSE